MTDIINEEENTTPLPEEEQETTVVDNGQTYVSEESAIIAQQAAQEAKLWAEESEAQANIATRGAEDAAQAKDDAVAAKNDAVAAKEYAEAAVTDVNLITVATDLRATPSNIKTVANNISDVVTVSGISSDVTTVANNTTNINTVAGVSSNVTTVATNILNVNNVSNISNAVVNVSNISADIARVDLISSEIVAVSSKLFEITTNSDNIEQIVINGNNINDIITTATNINAVNTAADNIVAIQNASANAQLARDWAIKMDGLVSGEDYSAKYYADQARQAAIGAVVDGVTINRNLSDELQTIGVIDGNSGNALKTWTGTLAEYNAIVTKDNNTLYWLTDGNKIYKGTTLIADNTVVDQIYDGTSTNAQSGVAVASAISGKANDVDVVHKTGDETISGVKTFNNQIHFKNSVFVDAASGDEGGEIEFAKAPNSSLTGNVKLDIYKNRMRIFGPASDGITREIINVDIEQNALFVPSSDKTGSAISTVDINKSLNGYVKLGNGIIIQWGVDAQNGDGLHTVTLPTPFTSVNYKVVGNVNGGDWSSNIQYINSQLISSSTTTTFTIYRSYNVPAEIFWIAIGY